jgi:penicillin-binding protein A
MDRRTRALRMGAFIIFLCMFALGVFSLARRGPDSSATGGDASTTVATLGLTKEKLLAALGGATSFYQFPSEVEIQLEDGAAPEKAVIEYAFDAKLQEAMEGLFRTYGPDYGAFVALDARTGRTLSMVSYSRNKNVTQNMALRATFPSASIFKVVTAAAAIEEKRFSANTVIPFDGRSHTLYRGNVFRSRETRWTRHPKLKDAFAQSINTVFGKIGAFNLEPAELRDYADRFGFNRKIPSDVPMQPGKANVPDDPWGVAESASGFTRLNTMSPLQGALIAASVVNDGTMMEPFVVQAVYKMDGTQVYTAEPKVANQVMDAKTAVEMRSLMNETVVRGTSRRQFRGFFRRQFSTLNVGGKTGSLTGLDPRGKYDWFVGFAENGSTRVAFAALTIHEKLWRVKSSYLARKAIETYFHGKLSSEETAAR